MWRIIFVAVLWLTSVARAMPSTELSLEYKCAAADRVLCGHIVSVVTVTSPASSVTSSRPWLKVTVAVSETYRGPADSVCTFFVEEHYEFGEPPEPWVWQTRPGEQLFFLVPGAATATRDPVKRAVPLTVPWWGEPIPLDGSAAVPRQDLTTAREAAEILNVARTYGSRPRPRTESIYNPKNANYLVLFVPLDESTDQLARVWAGSSDDALVWNAARILRNRLSPVNEAAIRSLLARPVSSSAGYFAHLVLADALRAHGESVRAPIVTTSPLSLHHPASLLALVPLLVLPLAWFRLWSWLWPKPPKSLTIITAVLSVAVAMMWVSSHAHPTALVGPRRDWVLSYGDMLFVWHERLDVTHAAPSSYASTADVPYLHDLNVRRGTGIFSSEFAHHSLFSETMPGWDAWSIVRVPLSWLFVLVCLPLGVVIASLWLKAWRDRRRRGFQVELTTPGSDAAA